MLVLALPTMAQDREDEERKHRTQLNLGMQLGFPRDDFKRLYADRAMFGFGGRLLFPIDQNLPFDAGFQFYYMWMGTEKETFALNNSNLGDYQVESKVHGSMMPFHLNLRLRPMHRYRSPIDPYIEGLAGFRVFYVNSEIQVDDLTPTEQPDPERSIDNSWAWSYGFAAGTGIRVAENIKLDFRYAKLWGTKAKYLDPESVSFTNDGDPVYNRKKSETNISNYEIGIIFEL